MSDTNKTGAKKSFLDGITAAIMKIAGPMGKFSQLPSVSSIQDGLVSIMPAIIVGSLFLIISLLGSDSIGSSGKAIIPALAPYVNLLSNVNSMTMGFIGFYAAITISLSYGEKLELDIKQSALIGVITFIFINFDRPVDNMISVKYFGSLGMFVSIITSLCSIRIFKFFIDKNIVIKLPASVPPNVGNAFTTLIPMLVITSLAWIIRSVLGFDFPAFMEIFLTPLLSASDSFIVFFLFIFLIMVLWSVGLNGPAMLSAIITPINTMALANNAAAKMAGEALPNIWTETFLFSYIWVASIFPLLLLMLFSKSKAFKAVSIASFPAAIFNIIEPTVFGMPIVLNIYLMIPFIISGTVGPCVAYLLTKVGFISPAFAALPWATPPFMSSFISTGDWKVFLVQALVFALGLIIYIPFFKMYEGIEMKQGEERVK